MKRILAGLLLTWVVIGCSSSEQVEVHTFTKEDICIIQTYGEKAKICYGMDRTEVERIVGTMEEEVHYTKYPEGVSIYYRDSSVAGIALEQGSDGKYTTLRGAKVGMKVEEIKKLYGDQHAVENAGSTFLDYYYDSVAGKYMDRLPMYSQEESIHTYIFSVQYDPPGDVTDRILMLDMRMAVFLE